MSTRRRTAPFRTEPAMRAGCRPLRHVLHGSALVLAGLGLLGTVEPVAAQATAPRVVAPTQVPVVRGVVNGQVVVNTPVGNSRGGQSLVVDQTSQRAIVDWRSFDIGRASDVTFYQPGTTASTLNRIHAVDPSVIQGLLRTRLWDPATGARTDRVGGQLLLLNQNGILFDRGSQVNVGSLIASTLNITNERFLSGVIASATLSATDPAFAGGYDDNGQSLPARPDGSRPGTIVLGSGGAADAAAPLIEASPGGSVLLFAPGIDNQGGIIRAPDGQVILAAGRRAFLAFNPDASDTTLRGLVVEVEADPTGSGLNLTDLVRNAGTISADRGNVTLAALAVNQAGRVSADTAVQLNGSVFLKGRSRRADGSFQAGTVTLAAGSQTTVDPDRTDTTTLVESQDYRPFRGTVQIDAGTIASQGTVRATGGVVRMTAADADTPSAARIYLDSGSQTSAAGAWADVDLSRQIVSFRVTSNELKNSPDQKDGLLRGASVTVDLRQDSTLLDLKGYRDTVQRSVSEKAAVGGDINLASTGSLVQREGAVLDVSGGGFRYGSGVANTTRLLGADGRIYDIATAPQALRYVAQLDSTTVRDERWGQTLTFANPLGRVGTVVDAYSEGKAAGTLTLGSRAGLVLDGTLLGGVTTGAQQLARAPAAGTLRIGAGVQGQFYNLDQAIGNLVWAQQASDSLGAGFDATTALAPARTDTFALAASQVFGPVRSTADGRTESGFGTVEVNSNGDIVVPASVNLQGDVGASLTLRARQIQVDGDVRLPAGTLVLDPGVSGGGADLANRVIGGTDTVTIGGGADLSTAGAWINNSGRGGAAVGDVTPTGRQRADGTVKTAIDGGDISVRIADAESSTVLARGASLDVGCGALLSAAGRVSGGRGGRLTIANGELGQTSSDWLQASLSGLSVGNGGELSLSLSSVQVAADGANGLLPSSTTRLTSGLFSDFGFSRVTVNAGAGDIDFVDGTSLTLRQVNRVVDAQAALGLPSGADLASVATTTVLPDAQRPAASLSLTGASVELPATASIRTDPRGQISLTATENLTVDGALTAPGGTISLSLNGAANLSSPDLHLGATARLSTAGTFVRTPDSRGLTLGTLYDGGSIAIAAAKTGVRIDAGAVLDVSGVNQVVDLVGSDSQPSIGQRTLSGHAGLLSVRSEGTAQVSGSLVGHGGDAAAAGGSFVLDVRRPDGQTSLPAAPRIVVTADGRDVAEVPGSVDTAVNVRALQDGGFEKLRLTSEGSVRFEGQTSLVFERGIRIDTPSIELGAGADVLLFGSTIAMGHSSGPRQLLDGVWGTTSAASPTPSVASGDGVLRVEGGTVDLFGTFGISGTRLTRVSSYGDLRLIGREVDRGVSSFEQVGALRVAGDLDLRAAHVYPATRTSYSISLLPSAAAGDGSRLSIATQGNNNPAGDVYSAGGSLRLEADTIVQAGVVKAPHGQLDLRATRRLELAPGSLTSVSGVGLTVLYGSTESGVTWSYVDGGGAGGANAVSTGTPIDSVSGSGKRIDLSAPAVGVADGARVDLSGGGDVRAVEFVAGNGGDSDATRAAGTFAIIPKSQLAAMPFDNDLQRSARGNDVGFGFSVGSGRDGVLYDAIDIGPGAVVPAGQYVLLPARYALLPDAFLVQLQTGSAYRNLQPGQTTALTNGDVVVAGHRVAAGTSVRESQSVGVVVLPGSALSRRSDYTLSGARLLAEAAERERSVTPAAPWDAGRLAIAGASTLDVQGSFLTASTASPTSTATREAEVDIASARIAIVGDTLRTDLPADTLQLRADSISAFNASVLLGGTRTRTADGVRIDTAASDVRVANDAASPVVLPELVLAARSSIDIDAGSVLRASGGTAVAAVDVIRSEATGALVRLSTGGQPTVDRGSAGTASGDVRIGSGALLAADGALLVDATRSTQSLGQLRAGGTDGAGGALTLSAGRISLGGDTGAGLSLSQADLAAYASLDSLVLRGYQGIDLVGRSTLGSDSLAALTLDTPQLRGVADAAGALQVQVRARDVTLANQGAGAMPVATSGSGTLSIAADRVVVGRGEKAVSGFAGVTLQANESLSIEGEGRLRAAADLTLRTPQVLAQGGAAQVVEAAAGSTGALAHRSLVLDNVAGGTTPATSSGGYGGRVEFAASDIRVATTVQANSGLIGLQALGTAGRSGDIALQDGAVLDASGRGKDFNGTRVVADAGRVALHAAGAVTTARGSEIDVSAAAEGGAAGTLALRAGSADLQGRLDGSAGTGQRAGSASLDLDRLATTAAFSTLNTKLDQGGFDEERRLRLRTGDLVVAASDDVKGRRVSLQADAGRIDVAGTVGSGAAAGSARVEILAGTGVGLAAGSRVQAGASDAGARGGEVRIATQSGVLAFDSGATIDVRAGDGGAAGSVVFGVRRDATHAVGATDLRGTVLRGGGAAPASVDVEATRVYAGAEAGSALSATRIGQLGADHQAFVAASAPVAATIGAALRDEGGALQGVRLLGATELRATGDLSVDGTWDLTSAAWLAGSKPGTLTLRAAGNLTLRDTVGAPRLATNSANATTNNTNQLANHAIRADDTWSIRMTAGADLAAADPLAAAPRGGSGGNLLMTGANAGIRTGTGRIDLVAAGDLRMDNTAQAIYTAGRIGAADTAVGGANRWAVDGGGISLRAGGDIVGPAGGRELWVTEWLRRDRVTPTDFARNPATDWWAYRPRFQQAVGTLAGGDIDIVAGGHIDGMSAMLPTLGRTTTDASGARQVEVTGGGNLDVRAGGDIRGGAFLVGRGQGRVEAGGDIGAGRDVQLYVMGASSGAVPEAARVDLVAGGDVNLRSVNNPTLMTMIGTTGATGPSFGTQPATANNNTPTRFFTYSANSAVSLQSKAGDVDVEGWIAEPTTYAERWRGFLSSAPNLTFAALGSNTAFPASFSAVALDGDVSGPRQERRIVTYPSPSGTVALLASGNVADFSLTASGLAPSQVITPFTRFTEARGNLSTSSFDTGTLVLPTLNSPLITARDVVLPPGVVSRDAGVPAYVYEVQALEGSVGTSDPGQPVRLVLPGQSRVRAGVDVVDVVLDLGHLASTDTSVVRADTGDIRYDATSGGRGVTVSGPGRVVLQAGRNIDLQRAAVAATDDARLTLAAGMSGDLDLARLGGADGAYAELISLNRLSSEVLDLYGQLAVETDPAVVLAADSIASLVSRNPAYARFAALDTTAPRALRAYQEALRPGTALSLPLGSNAQADAAQALYRQLNGETDLQRLVQAGSLQALAAAPGGEAYRPFVSLGESFPRLYADYVQRRSKGAVPTSVTPIVFSDALAGLVAEALPTASLSAGGGSILSYLTSVQTFGGGDIDLLAPAGNVLVGLTTPQAGATVGVLTLGGGAIRSIVGGDFNVNQGKVITAAGGDILLFSSAGSIDAGRGAKTSVSTPPPQVTRNPDGTTTVTFSAAATGSGIQSLSSDPDGVGPRVAPRAGDVYLFAPAGSIDAGEAGIRSGGNILVNAQAVRNATDIRAGGNSQGVPVAVAGSVASTVASSGTNTTAATRSGEDSAGASAARAAAAAAAAKPNILTVDVLGFGDKNCKEGDKDCFAK